MSRRHPEIETGDQRMKNGGEEKKRRWGENVMDTRKETKYVHQYQQKKVEVHPKTVVSHHSAKFNVESSDTTATVSKELSSNRFLVQFYHDDNSENIKPSANYRRLVDKIEEEDEDNISVSDECSEAVQRSSDNELDITHSSSHKFSYESNLDTKRLYQSSTKMASMSSNVMNQSRSRHHSKTHHHNRSHNSRRPPNDDGTGDGPASMIIMSQHNMMSNNNGDDDNIRNNTQDEQQLYSLQSHYGHNENNTSKHDSRGNNHHRHGGHKHRSNSHAHGERKHINRKNTSSDNNHSSDPEKHLVAGSESANHPNDASSNENNYKASGNGVFSSKNIKQSNRHLSGNNYPQHQLQQTYKSSKPTTMAELNAKRSKC